VAYSRRDPENPVVGRMAQYLATIDLAAEIAHAALPLPWAYENPVLPLWDAITQEATEADRRWWRLIASTPGRRQ
jgi:hypothetical protein